MILTTFYQIAPQIHVNFLQSEERGKRDITRAKTDAVIRSFGGDFQSLYDHDRAFYAEYIHLQKI